MKIMSLFNMATKKLILAEARLKIIEGEYEILDRKKGIEFRGTKYEPLYNFFPVENGHRAEVADFVTMEDGSGIVHIAPAFGADDYDLGYRAGLPFIQAVDVEGKISTASDSLGRHVCQAGRSIDH